MNELVNLYIDPGTGSMLFTVLISIVGFLVYFFRVLWVKVKFVITRGKMDKMDKSKIPLLIFAEAKRYWEVFEPIVAELDKRGVDMLYWTTSPDDPALDQKKYEHLKVEFVGEGNKAYAKLNMVNASVVVASTPGLDVYQWKRSKFVDHYVHVQHAANDIAGYRMFGVDYFDSILLSGQYQIDEVRELEKKRNLPAKELELVGIPYMDSMRQKIKDAPKAGSSNTTVLLAPSWGPNSIFNKFGTKVLDELIKTGYDIIVRPHPQSFIADADMMNGIISKYPENEHLKWDRNSDNFESLHKADIMISDFSGIIFDFTLAFDKPILYADTEFNPDCYDYWWLDRKPWTFEILDSLGLKLSEDNIGDIKSLIDRCLTETRFKEGRDKARSETWVHMDEGAVRTVDFILAKYKEVTEKAHAEKASK
jgi:hypothetical protein